MALYHIILIGTYCLIAGFTIGALITDSSINTNWKEAVLCVLAGFVWPLTLAAVIVVGLHEHVGKKRQAKRQIRNKHLERFVFHLYTMSIVTRGTWYNVRQRMSEL